MNVVRLLVLVLLSSISTMDQADDLKAFERRMIEIVSSLQPSIWRWRVILLILILVTLMTFYALISDDSSVSNPIDKSSDNSYLSSIYFNLFQKQIYFSVSLSLLIFAFIFGIHRKMFASSIIIARFRYILADYNMSCDSDGRLIIRPRPTTYPSGAS
jgi:hypothetical protein